MTHYDVAIVGAGIIGLATAYAAARRGQSVVVIDRDAAAIGASIRNFGFVTVSGQEPNTVRPHAERSRALWAELAPQAGIDVLQRGAVVAAQRPEALALLEAYKAGPHGADCRILTPAETARYIPGLNAERVAGGMFSPYELRVESSTAVPRLAAYLEERYGVTFMWQSAVSAVTPSCVETSRGTVHAGRIVVCPGDDLSTLFAERIATYNVQRCKLQMLRLCDPGYLLPSVVTSDLSLLRYGGYAMLPQAEALRIKLDEECADARANGVHLIVTQSADGSLVIGDSHHYASTPDPFGSQYVDQLILDEYGRLFGHIPEVAARWVGTYASSPDHAYFIDVPHPEIRLVVITSGIGATTSLSIGEEVISGLFPG